MQITHYHVGWITHVAYCESPIHILKLEACTPQSHMPSKQVAFHTAIDLTYKENYGPK